MKTILFDNKTTSKYTVMIEPIGTTTELLPNKVILMDVTAGDEPLRLDIYTENFISLWSAGRVGFAIMEGAP